MLREARKIWTNQREEFYYVTILPLMTEAVCIFRPMGDHHLRRAGGGKMADGGPDERQCIGSINRALKRYGSTCNHVKRPPSDGCVRAVIRHEIEEGDTLQGLALKYGTTVRLLSRFMPFLPGTWDPFTPKPSRFSLCHTLTRWTNYSWLNG